MTGQTYGAGIWHFATYVDRYATDGYGEPRTILDAIELAGQLRDLSVVDLNYPFFGGQFGNDKVKEKLDEAGLGAVGIRRRSTRERS
jgi:xylose isomerase